MKKILLLLLLTTLFVGCKKEDENENHRIAGKWVLTDIDRHDGTSTRCNYDKLVDEFGEDGKYFGFLPNTTAGTQQSYTTYSLKGDELKLYFGTTEYKYEVLYLDDSHLYIEYVDYDKKEILFMFSKYQENKE